MYLLKKTKRLGVLPISVSGGIFHNIGQITAATLIVKNYHVYYYLPVLLLAGLITGLLIGIAAQEIILHVGNRFKLG
jgi:heptaprenyl diphosphate synthase